MLPTKKVTIKSPEQSFEHDKAKKIYRSVCDIIKRLDNAQTKQTVCRDAFLPEVIFLRGRLQEYCEKLMFTWPLEYGRKAEEVIWRKGFYDVIQLIKKNIKEVRMDGGIDKAFKTHLSSAIGYYTRLLLQIQSKFEVQVGSAIDLGILFKTNSLDDQKSETKVAIKNWATQACFRSLVYLGDIARYQHDYDGGTKTISQRYYYQSVQVCPGLGLPFNQLGTLAGMNAYGFHAAYYYIRCIVSSTPFEGTNNNLMKLFEKNRKMLLDLENLNQHLPHNFHYRHPRRNAVSHVRSKDNKRFLLRFIHLVELFFTEPKECDKTHVYELCQVVLDDFDTCVRSNLVKSRRGPSSEEKQNVVDDDVIFKVFVVCLASIHHLSKRGHELVAASIAFSLAMFSHVLNFIITRLRPPSMENVDEMDDRSNPGPTKYSNARSFETTVCSKIVEESHAGGDDDDGDGGGDDDLGDRGDVVKERKVKKEGDDDDSDGDVSTVLESPQNARETERKKKKVALTSRRRTRGSDNDDGDDDDDEGKTGSADDDHDDYDADNVSSEVESEGALSDFDLLSSSDEGSGMESQPEDEEEDEEEEVRVPAYHKKADANVTKKASDKKLPIAEVQKFDEPIKIENVNEPMPVQDAKEEVEKTTETSNEPNMDEVSGTWMSDAASLLGRTLKMSYFGGEAGDDVISGNKNVPVPPGFERSLELHHVMEITEKLANFNIETDTDINQSDGDEVTGDHSDAEMEVEMEKKRQEAHKKEVVRILNMITGERILEPAKIFIEWMVINPLIVTSCAKISSSIWYRLATLLNLLPTEKDLLQNEFCTKNKNFANILTRELKNETDPERRVFPMTEDIHLLEFPPLKAAHQRIDYDLEEFINEKQEAIIRLCRLRMFCRSLSTLDGIVFNYERDSDSFKGPIVLPSNNTNNNQYNRTNNNQYNRTNNNQYNRTNSNQTNDMNSNQSNNSQLTPNRTSMMRNLAQMRVKSQWGRSMKEVAPQGYPVYLVPDAESIYEGIKLMKKLTHHDKLRIVVPKVVLSYLDSIKTTNKMTKKAVEWVEEAIYRNDQSHMRLQKPHETCLPPSVDSKHNKDDYILRIIDCCHFLVNHGDSSPSKESSTEVRHSVCLLTWMTFDTPDLSDKVKDALQAALEKGIKLKSVSEFFHQWQQPSSTIL